MLDFSAYDAMKSLAQERKVRERHIKNALLADAAERRRAQQEFELAMKESVRTEQQRREEAKKANDLEQEKKSKAQALLDEWQDSNGIEVRLRLPSGKCSSVILRPCAPLSACVSAFAWITHKLSPTLYKLWHMVPRRLVQ
jgi:hypothetical protein